MLHAPTCCLLVHSWTPNGVAQAEWRLRTYLKFPWRPLIDILGTTVYTLDPVTTRVRCRIQHPGASHRVKSPDLTGFLDLTKLSRCADREACRRMECHGNRGHCTDVQGFKPQQGSVPRRMIAFSFLCCVFDESADPCTYALGRVCTGKILLPVRQQIDTLHRKPSQEPDSLQPASHSVKSRLRPLLPERVAEQVVQPVPSAALKLLLFVGCPPNRL